jgi:hypothetical protein
MIASPLDTVEKIRQIVAAAHDDNQPTVGAERVRPVAAYIQVRPLPLKQRLKLSPSFRRVVVVNPD